MSDGNVPNMDVLNVEEAAAYLRFSTTYLYKLTKEKKIPHVNYGRHILFRKADLYNWLGGMVSFDGGNAGAALCV